MRGSGTPTQGRLIMSISHMTTPKLYTSPCLLHCPESAITSGACHIGLFTAGTLRLPCFPDRYLHRPPTVTVLRG